MANILESDFCYFLMSLNLSSTAYLLVGGYAVIIHGYHRTTQDLNIWVNKTPGNYLKLRKAFAIFGMPVFDMTLDNFMGDDYDFFQWAVHP